MMKLPQQLDGIQFLKDINTQTSSADTPVIQPDIAHRKLGYYYENILNSILSNNPYISDIKRNIQAREDKKTVGEFDFLVQNQKGENIHIECAVKFYLCTGDGTKLSHYEGPNRRDRLDLKWDKLLNKQIRLGETVAGRTAAQSLNMYPTQTVVLMQGYLFYPFNQTIQTLNTAINANHLRGWWIRNENRENILDSALRYQILEKPFWLTRPAIADKELLTDAQLNEYLTEQRYPQLVVRLTERDGEWSESDRGFVVQKGW